MYEQSLILFTWTQDADYKQLFTVTYYNKGIILAHKFIPFALNQSFPVHMLSVYTIHDWHGNPAVGICNLG